MLGLSDVLFLPIVGVFSRCLTQLKLNLIVKPGQLFTFNESGMNTSRMVKEQTFLRETQRGPLETLILWTSASTEPSNGVHAESEAVMLR